MKSLRLAAHSLHLAAQQVHTYSSCMLYVVRHHQTHHRLVKQSQTLSINTHQVIKKLYNAQHVCWLLENHPKLWENVT